MENVAELLEILAEMKNKTIDVKSIFSEDWEKKVKEFPENLKRTT